MSDKNCSHLGEPELCADFKSGSTRQREQVAAFRLVSYLGKVEVVDACTQYCMERRKNVPYLGTFRVGKGRLT